MGAPAQNFSSLALAARALVTFQVCGVLSGVDGGVCVRLPVIQRADSAADLWHRPRGVADRSLQETRERVVISCWFPKISLSLTLTHTVRTLSRNPPDHLWRLSSHLGADTAMLTGKYDDTH